MKNFNSAEAAGDATITSDECVCVCVCYCSRESMQTPAEYKRLKIQYHPVSPGVRHTYFAAASTPSVRLH